MKKIAFIIATFVLFSFYLQKSDWGFYGHRLINELACYTLPQELFAFFKPNVEFIRTHAVDPDKRRYALKKEAGRHYIDIDHWGDEAPYENLPRNWADAFNKMLRIDYVNNNLDTLLVKNTGVVAPDSMKQFFFDEIKPNYFADEWAFTCEDITRFFPEVSDCKSVITHDSLTDQGILPYGLKYTYQQLIYAFDTKEPKRILRHAADIGHYIGDAHVPLHTTVNYNGQLTGQDGIHAFWESRLPELYAEKEYDLYTGQAEYIDDIDSYIWDLVLDTHSHVDSVLLIEQRLRDVFPSDQQYCFEERLNRTVRIECEEFAHAYHLALDDMVEKQMYKSIESIGNIWYSAWVDAGQPDLTEVRFGTIEVMEDSLKLDFPLDPNHR